MPELDANVAACTRALIVSGVERGDRVCVLTTPRPESQIIFLGLAPIGANWVGQNPRYKRAEPCACGRTTFRFNTLGRSDDMFIVKGVNVFPLGVQANIVKGQPRLTGEFQIILDRAPPIDYAPRIVVEVARDIPFEKHREIIAETRAAIAREHNFASTVELVGQGTIGTEMKTRRLIRAYLEGATS